MTLAISPHSTSSSSKRLLGPLLRPVCDLEVIIPAYNEESRLARTLVAIDAELEQLDLESRIVVVDNASSDRTSEVVDRLVRVGYTRLEIIGCSTRGKGAAVQRGFLTSRAAVIGFVDADMAVPASAVTEAARLVEQGAPVVIASRRCPGAQYAVRQPASRRMGGWAFRTAIRPLIPEIADSQCGLKFFSQLAARRIFGHMATNGFAFDVEIVMRAINAGYPVTELPVIWSDQAGSSLRVGAHGGEVARDIVQLHRIGADLNRRRARVTGARNVPSNTEAAGGGTRVVA